MGEVALESHTRRKKNINTIVLWFFKISLPLENVNIKKQQQQQKKKGVKMMLF